jgi:hypothetical protein
MNSGVKCITSSDSNIYAGGRFETAGGVSANRIAKWDGASWSALGVGMDDSVNAIAVNGTDLYAVGFFFNAGGNTARGVAKWDGSSWSALGNGAFSDVWAIAVSGPDVYIAGGFSSACGGIPAHYVAKWDGTSWSALGSGLNHRAFSLAISDYKLYVGGEFTAAGQKGCNFVACCSILPDGDRSLSGRVTLDGSGFQGVSVNLSPYMISETTDSFGAYSFNDIPSETVTIRPALIGYEGLPKFWTVE